MVVRLPLIDWGADEPDFQVQWLPVLAPLLPVTVPTPLAQGARTADYPSEWGIHTWLEGANPIAGALSDPIALTDDLASFTNALHALELRDGPPTHRGVPLIERDEGTRKAIAELRGRIDTSAATTAWERALATPAWSGAPVWIHGDLMPGSLLVSTGRLTAVIDWECAGVGDPATDLIIAWNLLPASARAVFRGKVDVDAETWDRGRGWALSIALIALPYYESTNRALADIARHTIREVLAEFG
jgi:aminoglycoside phosphotransferase (APT) family kinase protein